MFSFIFYCKSGVNFENLCNTANGAQQDRVQGGTQQFSIHLSKLFNQDQLKLSSPVKTIELKNNNY